ncbi:MAG: sigma-70 family RNA polymerase sigma factor [Bacteroidia bacterium]
MPTTDFTSQVYQFSNDLKPVALNLTRDMEDAKDLMQETMLRALASQDKFKEGTNLKAWLYTIMKNIFINDYRKKSKRRVISDGTDNHFFINSSTSREVTNGGEGQLAMEDIDWAMERINPDFKTPFLMHFKGFKYQEIADAFSLPIGTVKSRIHFARKALKKQLNGMR